MVRPSVFPDSRVTGEYIKEVGPLVFGWTFSISRFTGHTRMVGPSVFPDSRVLKMLGPSVFPDSRVEKSSFETQNGLFRTDFKSETTSKYILDIP